MYETTSFENTDINSNALVTKTIPSKTGYKIVSVSPFTTGVNAGHIHSVWNGAYVVTFKNTYSSNLTVTIGFRVLYKKN